MAMQLQKWHKENNVKVPFPLLPPADLNSPCEIFFANAKKRTWAY